MASRIEYFTRLPKSAMVDTSLRICLKCSFDFFSHEFGLSKQEACQHLLGHIPEETDITDAATARPHFFPKPGQSKCPFCGASARYLSKFEVLRIDCHESFETDCLDSLENLPQEKFVWWQVDRSNSDLFLEWLDGLKRSLDLGNDQWLNTAAIEHLKRIDPGPALDRALKRGIKHVHLEEQFSIIDWECRKGLLTVSPALYKGILTVQHLLSRRSLNGARTFEGALSTDALITHMVERELITPTGSETASTVFNNLVHELEEAGPLRIYYVVDRSAYLKKLISLCPALRKEI
jgi:hypothetical protein